MLRCELASFDFIAVEHTRDTTMAHAADAASALLSFSGQESDSTPVGKRRQAPTRRPRNSGGGSSRGKRKDSSSVCLQRVTTASP